MLGVIRKDLPYWLYLPALFTIVLNWYWLRDGRDLRLEAVVLDSFFIYFLSIWPIVTVEGIEERHRGYAFLVSLPLRIRDVVTAKFVMPPLMAVALAAVDIAVLARLGGSPELFARCAGMLLLNACVAIDVAGLVYVIVYRYGVKTILVGMGAVILVLNVLGILAMRRLLPGVGRVFDTAGLVAPGVGLAVAAAAALAIYAGLLGAAIRIKTARNV